MIHHFLFVMSPLIMLANYSKNLLNGGQLRSMNDDIKSEIVQPVNILNKIRSESPKNFKKNTKGFLPKIRIDRSTMNKDLEKLNEFFWFEEPKKQHH